MYNYAAQTMTSRQPQALLATGFPQAEALIVLMSSTRPRKRNHCAFWPAPSFLSVRSYQPLVQCNLISSFPRSSVTAGGRSYRLETFHFVSHFNTLGAVRSAPGRLSEARDAIQNDEPCTLKRFIKMAEYCVGQPQRLSRYSRSVRIDDRYCR
jgi:hypothetical protein